LEGLEGLEERVETGVAKEEGEVETELVAECNSPLLQ